MIEEQAENRRIGKLLAKRNFHKQAINRHLKNILDKSKFKLWNKSELEKHSKVLEDNSIKLDDYSMEIICMDNFPLQPDIIDGNIDIEELVIIAKAKLQVQIETLQAMPEAVDQANANELIAQAIAFEPQIVNT